MSLPFAPPLSLQWQLVWNPMAWCLTAIFPSMFAVIIAVILLMNLSHRHAIKLPNHFPLCFREHVDMASRFPSMAFTECLKSGTLGCIRWHLKCLPARERSGRSWHWLATPHLQQSSSSPLLCLPSCTPWPPLSFTFFSRTSIGKTTEVHSL